MSVALLLRLAPCLALLVLVARDAHATCWQDSRLRPILPDCSVYTLPPAPGVPAIDERGRPIAAEPVEVWPASRPISAILETGGCCSPPGGSIHCSYQPANGSPEIRPQLIAWDAQGSSHVVAEGAARGPLKCLDGFTLFVFDRPVAPGTYTLGGAFGNSSVAVVADEELRRASQRSLATQPVVTPPPEPPATAAAPGCRVAEPGPLALLLGLPWVIRRRRSRS